MSGTCGDPSRSLTAKVANFGRGFAVVPIEKVQCPDFIFFNEAQETSCD